MTLDENHTSLAGALAALDASAQQAVLGRMDERALRHLLYDWRFWARPNQLAPRGDWRTWLILAGRGFGKTRSGAEWVRYRAQRMPGARIALVAATLSEARAVMVEGESGLLAIAPPWERPVFEPSLRRLTWPNGARAMLYSAEEPEQLRGPQHHFAWADEAGKWSDAEAVWMNLEMGLRLGAQPQVVVTTTPRPTSLIKRLLADRQAKISRGATRDNAANLPDAFLAAVEAAYAGTRLGRQELNGELVEDADGALWTRALLDAGRVRSAPDALARVVVAIDPPVTSGAQADACGIIVAGMSDEGHAYVLADWSAQGLSPEGWARRALEAVAQFSADRLIAEVNNGGELVATVLRSVDANVPYRAVRASRGKYARAEPIAALYERGRVHHVGAYPALEDELCGLLPGGRYEGPGRSSDRADALVWALSDLILGRPARPQIRRI